MEDTLKRLLKVETEAEQQVAQAQVEAEQLIQQALQEAHQAEQAFKDKMPEFKKHFLTQAEKRANQTIAEMNKRYDEKKQRLQQLALENQAKALEAATHLIMQIGKP